MRSQRVTAATRHRWTQWRNLQDLDSEGHLGVGRGVLSPPGKESDEMAAVPPSQKIFCVNIYVCVSDILHLILEMQNHNIQHP